MNPKKRSWFFYLLSLLASLMLFGAIFAGCDASVITIGGGLVLGGLIGNLGGHVFIGIIVGGIIGVIVFCITNSSGSTGGNTSSGIYSGSSTGNHSSSDRSNYIAAKDCEAVKPEMRTTCCDSLMFNKNNYDLTTCWKYRGSTNFANNVNIFQKNMTDCFYFKRVGKCPLAEFR